jgi:hypothetical protein
VQLELVAAKCRELGASVEIVPTDVTVVEDCKTLATVAAQKFNGAVDLLILNAGIGMRGKVDEITDPLIYKHLIDTNYLGCVWVTHFMVKLINAAAGRIVVVSSASGRLGVPRFASHFSLVCCCLMVVRRMAGYSGSKHALHGFFDALRCEGTAVTIVCPGFVATDMPQKNLSGILFSFFHFCLFLCPHADVHNSVWCSGRQQRRGRSRHTDARGCGCSGNHDCSGSGRARGDSGPSDESGRDTATAATGRRGLAAAQAHEPPQVDGREKLEARTVVRVKRFKPGEGLRLRSHVP